MIKTKHLQTLFFILCSTGFTLAQHTTHTADLQWESIENTSEIGISNESLGMLDSSLDSVGTAAFMVIYKGKVLYSYGDVTRRFMVHSIRKSFMNAMIGREVAAGTIHVGSSLELLGVDDKGLLTPKERQATVMDLMTSRSGIFHPSAYSPRGMESNLPQRGSHRPGTYFFYNNWDFNALLTIYKNASNKDFFEAFKTEIAIPIGMTDFRELDTHYRLEKGKSLHPAYLFKMSARDMARFGQLYLNKGTWGENVIVPPNWVQQSTTAVTRGQDLGNFEPRGGYGMLWWVGSLNEHRVFSAIGTGENRIMVFPDNDMVIVHRSDTYQNKLASSSAVDFLAATVLEIVEGVKHNIALVGTPFEPPVKSVKTSYEHSMEHFTGSYKNRMMGTMSIQTYEKDHGMEYVLENKIGRFKLIPVARDTFFVEDLELQISIEEAGPEEEKMTAKPVFGENRTIEKFIFFN